MMEMHAPSLSSRLAARLLVKGAKADAVTAEEKTAVNTYTHVRESQAGRK
jgi:hypothetical protein